MLEMAETRIVFHLLQQEKIGTYRPEALAKLAEDAELRKSYGAAARRMAEAEFAEEIVIAKTLALYQDCAGLPDSAKRR